MNCIITYDENTNQKVATVTVDDNGKTFFYQWGNDVSDDIIRFESQLLADVENVRLLTELKNSNYSDTI